MLLTESPWNASAPTALEPAAFALRLHGGTEHEQSIPIPPGKHSIGSGPRCALRLQFPGVVPLHCLIAYDGETLRVRRWAEHTYLNGQTFEEAPLVAGDVLTVGPLDLEVDSQAVEKEVAEAVERVVDEALTGSNDELETSLAALEEVPAATFVTTPAKLVNSDSAMVPESSSYGASLSSEMDATELEPTELEDTADYLPVARVRDSKVTKPTEIPSNEPEEHFAEVDRAIGELSLLDEPEEFAAPTIDETKSQLLWREEPTELDEPLLLTGPKAEVDGAAVEPAVEPIADKVEEPVAAESVDVTSAAAEAVFRELQFGNAIARGRSRKLLSALRYERDQYHLLADRVSALEQRLEAPVAVKDPHVASESTTTSWADQFAADAEPAVDTAALEEELVMLKDRLEVRDSDLAHARYSIDVLERQLIDSQHTMNAFADERAHWDDQFTQLEAQLSAYVARIQELEQQLEEVRASRTFAEEALSAAEQRAAAEAIEVARFRAGLSQAQPQVEPAEPDSVDCVRQESPRETVSELVAPDAEPETVELVDEQLMSPPDMSKAGGSIADLIEAELAAEPIESSSQLGVDEARADAPTHDEEQVDAALEHLRDLAILRQDVTESAVAEDATPEVEAPPIEQPKSQPTSFLERYSHMFSEDADDAPAPEPPPRREPVMPEPVAADGRTATHGDDEESIENYMSKLMDRMRGSVSSDASTVKTEPVVVQQPEKEPEVERVAPLTSLDELKPKTAAPEYASDILAMRALANESARHAIGVHTARTLRRKAKTRAVVSLLGAAVGFYLLLLAPSWKSMQFVAGCVASITALYWGRLTLISLIKGIQLGAFEDLDEISNTEETLHPKLPIDVEPVGQK